MSLAPHRPNHPTPLRIAIIGAGIAGLAAAAMLRRHGHGTHSGAVTVYERHPTATAAAAENGAGITLAYNGVRMARALGLTAAMMPTIKGRGFRIFDRKGKVLYSAPWRIRNEGSAGVNAGGAQDGPDADEDDRDLDGWWMLHRQDLKAALLHLAAGPGEGAPVQIKYGWQVVEADPETGRLVFANGERVHADLIIGADGIHSEIRNTVIPPDHPKPRPTGLSTYRFCLATSAVKAAVMGEGGNDRDLWPPAPLAEDSDTGDVFLTMVTAVDDKTGRSVVLYPCRDGDMFSFACFVPDATTPEDENETENENEGDRAADGDGDRYSWTAEGKVDEMVESFTGFPDWLTRIFRRAPDVKLLQVRDLEPLPVYAKGRTVLIGDAAHAMVPYQGQGANQALEDVEGLGILLEPLGHGGEMAKNEGGKMGHQNSHRSHPNDVPVRDKVPAILQLWDSVRRPRATAVGLQSRAVQQRMTPEAFSAQAQFNWKYRGIRHALSDAAAKGKSRF